MANLPPPVVGAGGGGGRPAAESLLLALASSAPGMLMQFLGQRQQSADMEAQGQASTSILAEMARNGTLSPELFQSVGGSMTPGSPAMPGVQGAPVGQNAPINIAPQAATAPRVDASGINSRVAPQLLQQLMSTQQSQAGIEASRAQTAATTAESDRAAELQPLRIRQIKESLITERFNRDSESRRLKLAEKSDARQAGNEAARIGIERERLGLARREALENTSSRLSSIYSDQFSRFTNMAQLYASSGLAPDAAKARAAADVWRTTKPPTLDEFLGANTERATASILTAGDTDPDAALLKTVFGDRPDVEYGSKIGLQPEQIEFLNQQLETSDGNGASVLQVASKTMPLEGEAKAMELAKLMLYLSYKTGSKMELPSAEQTGIRAALKRLVGTPISNALPPALNMMNLETPPASQRNFGAEIARPLGQVKSVFINGAEPPEPPTGPTRQPVLLR